MNRIRQLLRTLFAAVVLIGPALALPGCAGLQHPLQRPATAIPATVPPSSPASWTIIAVITSTPASKSEPAVVTVMPTPVAPTPEPAPTSTPVPAEPESPAVSTPVPVEPTPEPAHESTLTPVPVEPDPELTSATRSSGQAMGAVSAPALNVRQGPGSGFAAIGVVRRGHRFTILDGNPAGTWLHVCCVNGKEGWVGAHDLQLSSSADVAGDVGAGSEEATGESPTEPSPTPPPTPAPSSSPLMRVTIPDLAVDAPVVEVGWVEVEVDGKRQTQWEVADFAAGYHKNSASPGQVGNVVISGHHNIKGKVFKNISLAWNDAYAELQEDGITWRSATLDGRSVYLYNAEGQKFQYVIDGLYKMPDLNVSEEQRKENARFMAPTAGPALTLITCWPYATNTHRIVVVAKMVQ